MINWVLKKIVGSKNTRLVKSLRPLVARINELEVQLQSLSDDELRAKVAGWKERLAKIEEENEQQVVLHEILPEAFAAVKNAARRMTERKATFNVCDQPYTWAMVHFDVQLIGGICLHRGMIAEMATGEGKTLVATLPLFLNALTGKGAHLVTTNDYLARRDGETMGQLYGFLGLTTGILQHDQYPTERRAQYYCDITYGMNSEFGFDYLRDNGMATSKEQQVQRDYHFAIVDEVDSILIDEARTPLIISGPATVSTHQYDKFKPLVEQLVMKQTMLCNRLVSDAEELFKAGKNEEAARLMVKVKLGQPRNKGFLRMQEDHERRRAIDKMELSFYGDTRKEEFFALKEELFFTMDERAHEADLSEQGRLFMNPDDPDTFVLPDLMTQFAEIDQTPGLTDAQKIEEKQKRQAYCDHQSERIHNISQLLRAYCLFERDVQYVVEDGKVVIVDEFTGRKMTGRRWSDGLHGAVEAKENVNIERETQTLATITIQNYFRLYYKLAGMTGTAETEANEFSDVYKLDVAVIPTNQPCIRKDMNDFIYKTRREKFNSVVKEIVNAHARQQPVLVGTVSVEASEVLSRMLKREKVPHAVLNAKYHMQEAEIISRAGQPGSVTISTNMAGRGTDIKLGPGVTEVGGLYVIGTERHESRRIDRQLRGRCARQGDPGLSRFYVSFEDDLMRNFGAADRMTKMMERFGLEEGQELEHPWLNKSVETAQKRVEQRNYMIRKRSLDFDDVMNKQREVVYAFRNDAINTEEPRPLLYEVVEEAVPAKVMLFLPEDGEEHNPSGLLHWVNTTFPMGLTAEAAALDKKTPAEIGQYLVDRIKKTYELKCSHEPPEAVRYLERNIILNAVDRLWQEHLYATDALREAVYLRAYGQKDPLVEYKTEAYDMFTELMTNIKTEIVQNLFRSTANLEAFGAFLQNLPQFLISSDETGAQQTQSSGAERPSAVRPPPREAAIHAAQTNGDHEPSLDDALATKAQPKREAAKVGRNDPCPCGSGKKYKNCCGRTA
ncbi:MAG: preprotein translocase subunit SecA [Chthoniobacter sp.]|nr:preprotein translocase subunit SecA [Chthoniobacter sp.]